MKENLDINDDPTKAIIRTYKGHYINVLDPDPDHIDIEDIAHALSHQPRFTGHTIEFFSVAHHCINCALSVPEEYRLEALMHDASEAYMSDISSPLKAHLSNYKEIEHNLMLVVAKKFKFQWPLSNIVKAADKLMFEFERNNVVICKNENYFITSMQDAKSIFLHDFKRYSS
jgi:hypothetical protein